MLEFQQPALPHMFSSGLHLPSPNWPRSNGDDRDLYYQTWDKTSTLTPPRLSLLHSYTTTPPFTMHSSYQDTAFQGSMNSRIPSEKLELPPFKKVETLATAEPAFQPGARLNPEGSVYNYSRTPESVHTFTSANDMELHSSPARTGPTVPTLTIPPTIAVPQDDLSDLAAEVACLFWFEPKRLLDVIERSYHKSSSPIPMNATSTPTEAFRTWLRKLLVTTQVAPNVIILALLFIYRLKESNPRVIGKTGSEFRLMTVALMLGNKYLDDNTYTNKTWAEVSGITVNEVHTMEVEFLSNMRFSLFTTKRQWMDWHSKLGYFGTATSNFIKAEEVAARALVEQPLPSPSPMNYLTPAFAHHLSNQTTPVLLPQASSTAVSPIGSLPELGYAGLGRKRFMDDVLEPPAKRHLSDYQQLPSLPPVHSLQNSTNASGLRMHLPALTIPPTMSGSMQNQAPPTLPLPGSRAMSLVYNPAQSRAPQIPQPMMAAPLQTSAMTPPSFVALDPVRQLSPYQLSNTSSPVSNTPHSNRLSPSYFLTQRPSPYRPVRRVQTLLVPPPAPTSVYNAPSMVGQDQMQYHSLGQPLTERHYGHLPYMHQDSWAQHQQHKQQWPQ